MLDKELKQKIINFLLIKSLVFGGGFITGVKIAEDFRRVAHYLFFKSIPVEEGFYGDMYDIKIVRPLSENGHREIYLVDNETEENYKRIGPNLITGTIEERIESIKQELGTLPEKEKYALRRSYGELINIP